MFLSWKITDDISNITVEEFNKEYNGLYGFIKLKIGDYSIGYIPENNVSLGGNSDILYYIKKLIECGINICKKDVWICRFSEYALHLDKRPIGFLFAAHAEKPEL